MGRDVTGYVTDKRMEGPWDNFQCKQLGAKLSENAAFIELGKIFCTGSDCLDTVLQLRRPLVWHKPGGLRGVT